MNYFSKIRIGTWVVIILTLLNLAILGTILYKGKFNAHPSQNDEDYNKQRREREMHWKQLDLSPEQEVKFRQMGKMYIDSSKKIYKLRDSLAKEISNELKKDNPDILILNKMADEMGKNYTRVKYLTIDHLLKLKQECRPEQIHKLDSLYYKLIIGFDKPPRRRLNPRADSLNTHQEH